VKAFALDATANRASQTIGCSYPVAHAMFAKCRMALVNVVVDERMAVREKLGLANGSSNPHLKTRRVNSVAKDVALAVIGWKQKVHVIDHPSKEKLLDTVSANRLPCIVFYAERLTSLHDLVRQPVADNRLGGIKRSSKVARVEAFWQNASDRILRRARGVASEGIAAYLGEEEYRFNHSSKDLAARVYSAVIPSLSEPSLA